MSLRQWTKTVGQFGMCIASPEPDSWFREEPRGEGALRIQRRYARQACAGCPVQVECLAMALSSEAACGTYWGIWGGVCAGDRRSAVGVVPLWAADAQGVMRLARELHDAVRAEDPPEPDEESGLEGSVSRTRPPARRSSKSGRRSRAESTDPRGASRVHAESV